MRYSWHVRVVDRYVGSFILFIFTLINYVRPKQKDRSIKRIVIIELVEMAASVMGYSSLAYIKKEVPEAEIFVVCTETTKEAWYVIEGIKRDHVFPLDNSSTISLIRSVWQQTRALSRKDIDLVIDFELFTRISAIISFLIRAKHRAGFYGYTTGGLYRGEFLDVRCNFNQNTHIAKNLLALTKSALDPFPKYYNWEGPIKNDEIVVPHYQSDPAIKSEVKKKVDHALGRKPERVILVAPTVGAMLPMRDYPKELYVEVIKKLLPLYPSHDILLVGTPSHSAVADYIAQAVADKRCTNFCGQTATLAELLELFSMASVLLGNDSGNPHFAAMVGLKNVAIYGPETPFMYGPLGRSVCLFEFFHSSPSITSFNHKNPPSDDRSCLRSIAPDRVVGMVQLVMNDHGKYGTVNNDIPYML